MLIVDKRLTVGIEGEAGDVRHDNSVANRQNPVDLVSRRGTATAFRLEPLVDRKERVEAVNGCTIGAAPGNIGAEVPVGDVGIVKLPPGLKFTHQRFDCGSRSSVVIRLGDYGARGCRHLVLLGQVCSRALMSN
jgi:hypothetical protein